MADAMLLRKEDYEGSLVRDEAAGYIPSAMREVYEIVYITDGSAEYWIEDQHYKLAAGDILLIPAGVMVSANLKQRGIPFVRYGVWFSHRFMTFLQLQDDDAHYAFKKAKQDGTYLLRLKKEEQEPLMAILEQVCGEAVQEGLNLELSSKSLLSSLIVQLNRKVYQRGDSALQKGGSNRLSPVLTHIHDNCIDALSVEQLAEQFDYSSSHLAHSFKKQLGTSLYHYVLLRRLQIGRDAMLDGVPVKEAYQKCGFGDYAGFYRAFTKEYGMSPQQYKKKYQ